MRRSLEEKSGIEAIRSRFDADVDRFSTLETGQSSTVDAPIAMQLITKAARATTEPNQQVLDLGCGAGNNTLSLLSSGPGFNIDLLDLSAAMLERARSRVQPVLGSHKLRCLCGDFRELELPVGSYDVIVAAAVLHHLRDEDDWRRTFDKLHGLLRPGGSLWITDLVLQDIAETNDMMWKRYGEYLCELGGVDYIDKVLAYIDEEDSPRPLLWQLDLLRDVGFEAVDVLHKHSCFAAYGGRKAHNC